MVLTGHAGSREEMLPGREFPYRKIVLSQEGDSIVVARGGCNLSELAAGQRKNMTRVGFDSIVVARCHLSELPASPKLVSRFHVFPDRVQC